MNGWVEKLGMPAWGLVICVPLIAGIVYLAVIKPFIEGMGEANRKIDRQRYRFPERCPMCGEITQLTRRQRCAYCGEDLGPDGQ